MSTAWYAIVDHVGDIRDLVGQEVVIARVRTSVLGAVIGLDATARYMSEPAAGRAWCRCFATGLQVPTRGGIMRVRAHYGTGAVLADMLSADELLVRARDELVIANEALRMVIGERDHLRGEVQRWRDRAAGLVDATCSGCGDPIATGDVVAVGQVSVHRACYASLGHAEVAALASECQGSEP
jgi:hypothetical protein